MIGLWFVLRVLTSQWVAPLDCPVTVTHVATKYATISIPACQGEPGYALHVAIGSVPECARVVGGWLACESIGYVPPNPPPCYPFLDGHDVDCHYGPGVLIDERPAKYKRQFPTVRDPHHQLIR